jgi:hypothetical protein
MIRLIIFSKILFMNYNSGRICEVNLKNMQLAQKYYLKYLAMAKPEEEDEKKHMSMLKKDGARRA